MNPPVSQTSSIPTLLSNANSHPLPLNFKTISAPAEASFTEQKSKFLSFIHPVESAEDAKAIVKDYAKRFYDARHVCWAYMIGADRLTFLSSDNGEPSGTAGKPILGQINSFEITNVVIAVVRYFGGIKLGTSGLIAAYREAARLAIEAADIVESKEMTNISFTFPYIAMNDVMKLIKSSPARISDQSFDNTCAITLSLPLDDAPALLDALSKLSGVSVR